MSVFGSADGLNAVYITLRQRGQTEDGSITIGGDCASDQAIDGHIEFLKGELDRAGKDAKKRLHRLNERIRQNGLFSNAVDPTLVDDSPSTVPSWRRQTESE
jgi:hypothetical protein